MYMLSMYAFPQTLSDPMKPNRAPPPAQRAPASTAALLDDVLELHDGHAYELVLPREAVVLAADVQLVTVRLILVAKDTENSNVALPRVQH